MKTHYRALTIAGSDSGGGAGIQADLKTFSALKCYGMSVVTALTAQNTCEVTGIFPVSPAFIGQQMDAVFEDIGVDAVKIGMLHSPEVIHVVADRLEHWDCPTVVLDPVMVSKSGDRLLQADAVNALKRALIPLATLITPNLPEASRLLGKAVDTVEGMAPAAAALSKMGCPHVLIKGGHLKGDDSGDLLYTRGAGALHLPGKRIATANAHGTGCTLSSAITAYLARGMEMTAAVKSAKGFISRALQAGAAYRIGRGHGPVHHFFGSWS